MKRNFIYKRPQINPNDKTAILTERFWNLIYIFEKNTAMNKIISNARQIIEEQYNACLRGDLSLRDYVETEFENNPDSFFWLFDAVGEEDFDTSLNEEQRNAYNEFLETL